MHLILISAALWFLFIQSAPVWAAKDINANNGPIIGEDLTFPSAPEPFGYAKASKMFKPAGTGPFPALVILPTCAGHVVASFIRCLGEGCTSTRVCRVGGRPLDAARRDSSGCELPSADQSA
jgi:hypothetical protein